MTSSSNLPHRPRCVPLGLHSLGTFCSSSIHFSPNSAPPIPSSQPSSTLPHLMRAPPNPHPYHASPRPASPTPTTFHLSTHLQSCLTSCSPASDPTPSQGYPIRRHPQLSGESVFRRALSRRSDSGTRSKRDQARLAWLEERNWNAWPDLRSWVQVSKPSAPDIKTKEAEVDATPKAEETAETDKDK